MDEALETGGARLLEDPRVLAVWGFGSRAEDGARSGPDVDLAVLLTEPVGLREELRLRAAVVETLRRDDIDLVVLNEAPPLLRYEAVAHGRLLGARDRRAAERLEERALREYLDTAHLRRVQRQAHARGAEVTLRPETVRERLKRLRQAVRNLRELRTVPLKEFVSSFRHYWLAERGLQLAAEALFDAGNQVLVGHFNVHPSDYEDVIAKLGAQGVLSVELRERLRGLGGFRNVLVHGYLDIDEGRVYDAVTGEALDDLVAFADELEVFLGSLEA